MRQESAPPRDFSRQSGLPEIFARARQFAAKLAEVRRMEAAQEVTPEEALLRVSDLYGEYVANPTRPPANRFKGVDLRNDT